MPTFATVKMISCIMAWMVMTLSCLPCTDSASAMKAGDTPTGIAKQENRHDTGHEDACSPFCHCTCCAAYSVHPPGAAPALPSFLAAVVYPSYLPGNPVAISLPVWQPPKIEHLAAAISHAVQPDVHHMPPPAYSQA